MVVVVADPIVPVASIARDERRWGAHRAAARWDARVDAIRSLADSLAYDVHDATDARRRALQVAVAQAITLGVEARERARGSGRDAPELAHPRVELLDRLL
ncbi:hypothetical protein [Sandaracinus amylolyticus]|uniref:hypothetical protein n=1 Tax=Sandaracinus amylolyticus TaxID=927083 RepID=UPI0014704E95|nr:hypothetical protein [Sandaracinus amylolyticus]